MPGETGVSAWDSDEERARQRAGLPCLRPGCGHPLEVHSREDRWCVAVVVSSDSNEDGRAACACQGYLGEDDLALSGRVFTVRDLERACARQECGHLWSRHQHAGAECDAPCMCPGFVPDQSERPLTRSELDALPISRRVEVSIGGGLLAHVVEPELAHRPCANPACGHSWLDHTSEPVSTCRRNLCLCLAYRDPDQGGSTYVERLAQGLSSDRQQRSVDPMTGLVEAPRTVPALPGPNHHDALESLLEDLVESTDDRGRIYVRIHEVDLRAIEKIHGLASRDESRRRTDVLDRIAALAGDLLERYRPRGPTT